jgi:filamentous hemagglutinin
MPSANWISPKGCWEFPALLADDGVRYSGLPPLRLTASGPLQNVVRTPALSTRLLPGIATTRGHLPVIVWGERWLRGSHGNAGRIPRHIAQRLNGRSFLNFDKFREAFWIEVANDPLLQTQFTLANLSRMRLGKAPFAVQSQKVGLRAVYELDHFFEIQHGGGVYDLDKIIIRTPLNHIYGK